MRAEMPMPRRKRDHLKRAIANAISYTQDAASWVIVLHDQFDGVHEDYAAYLRLILQVEFQAGAMLQDFWKKALGTEEVNWEAYTTIKAAFENKQLAAVSGRTKSGKGRLKKPIDIVESELEDVAPAPLDREHR
jgi:hypothetical protein